MSSKRVAMGWVGLTLLLALFVSLVVALEAQELPWRVKDKYSQRNFEELSNWRPLRMYDCGSASLTAGSTFVQLHVNYNVDSLIYVIVVPDLTGLKTRLHTFNFYIASKVSTDTLQILAIEPSLGIQDTLDNNVVMWFTFFKDR